MPAEHRHAEAQAKKKVWQLLASPQSGGDHHNFCKGSRPGLMSGSQVFRCLSTAQAGAWIANTLHLIVLYTSAALPGFLPERQACRR